MSKKTIEELNRLQAEAISNANECYAKANQIIDAKNGRLSKAEQDETAALKTQGDEHKAKAKHFEQQVNDQLVMNQANALADELGMPIGGVGSYDASGRPTVRAGNGRTFGANAAATIRQTGAEFGVKALLSGTIDVPNPITTGIVTDPQAPTTFLDLIVDRRGLTSNTFNFLRQSSRVHNAGVVPDGAQKPTSVYQVEDVEDRVRVVAHLSEPIPERYFADHAELERFLNAEMEAGLLLALEAQVANGAGPGPDPANPAEDMTGILNTSGTVAVPFAGDTLTTARKAVTALRSIGERPTAWVLNPTDDEAFDLVREDGATGGFLLDQGEALWRIPRLTSPQVPAGTAILADWRQARLVIREDVQLAADRSGSNFQTDQVQLRVEGRFGFAVLRPQAFAVVDLSAAA